MTQPSLSPVTSPEFTVNKIAEVTLVFWVLKILATTLGETTGDLIAQTLGLGYLAGLGITGAALVVLLAVQIRAQSFHPALFWAAIVGTTTAGTEISDFMDRSLGLGYMSGSVVLTLGLLATLWVWHRRDGTLSVDPVTRRDTELAFWVAVLFSNSLGTAFGDFLTKPLEKGGLDLGTYNASAVCLALMAGLVFLETRRMRAKAIPAL